MAEEDQGLTSRREVYLTLDLCLRVGEMLLASGAGAADVTATIRTLGQHLGLRHVEIDVNFTVLSISHQPSPEEVPATMVRVVHRRDLDYADLTAVDHLVQDLLSDRTDLYLARTRMATIVSTPSSSPRWLVSLAWGVMCAAVAVFLGGGPVVAAVACLAAVLIDRIQGAMTKRRLPQFYVQVAGGVVATAFAIAMAVLDLTADPSLVVTATIIMLLAGIGFMGAIQDALTGFYMTATARILEALLATAGIVAGVSLGITTGELLGVDLGRLVPGRSGVVEIVLLVGGTAVAAAAFAVATKAPWRAVLPVGVIAAAASLVSHGLATVDVGRTWQTGAAGLLIGLVAYAVAGRVRVPPLVVAVPAIVPFLPGLAIYKGLSLLAEGGAQVSFGILSMMTAASVATALAAGVILGEYVAQPLKREARRLEERLSGPRLVGPLRPLTRAERKLQRRRIAESAADEVTD
ncbi:MAG: threonine/serine exporter ThrE family protein [Nocardioides sp.]|uniref:threonine/serine ThrE exporter family protein n=1 Tax=Nocardioides sp. TaxID=35761 RepID=UPI003EFEC7AD